MYVIILVAVLVFLVYLYGTSTFNYWKNKGIKHDDPLPFLGNNLKQFMQRSSIGTTATDLYNKYPNEKVVGFYRGITPELLVRDPEIIKRILSTDFQHFHARGFNPHKTVVEPLLRNMFSVDGDTWKLVRQRFSPTFSTSKLKAMFQLITERAEKLQSVADDIAEKEYYDIRELMARYTTEFIGACGFGINMESLTNENSQFRWLGKRIFQRNFRDGVIGALKFIFPELCKNLNLMAPEIEKAMMQLMGTLMKQRDNKPIGTHDFLDLFLELKQQGTLVGASIEQKNPDGTPKKAEIEFTDILVVAQMFVLFGAGFETSSTAASVTLHQLAFHPDCQKKVQEEIDRVLAKHNGKITYDAINEMKYLEMAFHESMRLFPSVAFLIRMCTSPTYTIPEINLTIEEDIKVVIPIQAIFWDKKYFPDPDKFDPDRFLDNNLKSFYIPFGNGPRACVGARLGQMQSIAGIVAILQKYSVEPAPCSKLKLQTDPTSFVAEGIIGGVPLKLRKRSDWK